MVRIPRVDVASAEPPMHMLPTPARSLAVRKIGTHTLRELVPFCPLSLTDALPVVLDNAGGPFGTPPATTCQITSL